MGCSVVGRPQKPASGAPPPEAPTYELRPGPSHPLPSPRSPEKSPATLARRPQPRPNSLAPETQLLFPPPQPSFGKVQSFGGEKRKERSGRGLTGRKA